jgi:hypothetical protein
VEGSSRGLIKGCTEKNYEKSQESRSTGRDLNPGPPEYKSGVLTAGLKRSDFYERLQWYMCHYFTEPFPYTEAFSILLICQGPSSQSTRMHFKTRLLVTASKALLSYCICITYVVPSRFDPYCFQPFQFFQDAVRSSFCLSDT